MNFFIPDIYLKSIFDINLDLLSKNNIQNIFFDVDNTLLTYQETIPNDKTINYINLLKKKGFNCFLFSNSNDKRIDIIKNTLKVEAYVSCMKPLKKNYKKVLRKYNKENCIFIGDQFMTDVLGAKRNGFKVILVERLNNIEPLTTKFWRIIESIILKILKINSRFVKGNYYE